MIECPWCGESVYIMDSVCPACRMEVLPEHLAAAEGKEMDSSELDPEADLLHEAALTDLEAAIESRFRCKNCDGQDCEIQEVAMSGTGLSKIMDIEYNHYLFVTCTDCGVVVVYNPDVLRGHRSGRISTLMDILFG